MISIIMPVYNKYNYLTKSLNSIINQTYKDFELIIVDDGSSDGSEKLCDEFAKKDERIRVIHLKNSGVSNARNVGLDNAKGKYLQFIDSDDYISEDMLEKLYNKAAEHDVDIVISGITKVNHNYEVMSTTIPQLEGVKSKNEMLENFASEQRSSGIYGYISNKFTKKSIVEKFKLRFNTNIRLAEDLDFYLELYRHIHSVYFYNTSFYYYIQDTDNNSLIEYSKNEYPTQISISLKQKELLSQNNMLNDANLKTINLVITNFTLCYIYDKFDFSYSKYKKNLVYVYSNNAIQSSLSKNNQTNFNKIIVFFTLKNISYLSYTLLLCRTIVRNIYRLGKSIITNKRLSNTI